MSSALRVVVLGYIVRGPLGGLAWHHAQYVDAIARLGHDVWFVEIGDDFPSCFDPSTGNLEAEPTYGLEFASAFFSSLGLAERWLYFDRHRNRWVGPAGHRASDVLSSADVVLNISGVNPLSHGVENASRRVLIDTDPVFTQVRHLDDASAAAAARNHTHFFTYAENWGTALADIPDDGLPWHPTRQPVMIDRWPATSGRADSALTTVMQWESYPSRKYDGRTYATKAASFPVYADLPRHTAQRLEIALGGDGAPAEELRERGWSVVNSLIPTRDPWTYQDYIARSKAEFSVAKRAYVETSSGWFSERSAAYLASGRPVIVEDTGFTRLLEVGAGLFAFHDLDSALTAIDMMCSGYHDHCRTARDLAAEAFAPQPIIEEILGLASPRPAGSTAYRRP